MINIDIIPFVAAECLWSCAIIEGYGETGNQECVRERVRGCVG